MKWSFSIGRLWGTEIRLHALLVLLIPYVLWQFQPRSLLAAAGDLALFGGMFVCILLHELGHTLFARLYGIQVHSILLWPLGGFASLSRQPQRPLEMLLIAAAGPLVNLLLGAGLLALSFAGGIWLYYLALPQTATGVLGLLVEFLRSLGVVNLILGISNLLPIYPLDGGQIFRAGLEMVVGRRRADLVALIVALPLAAALAFFGIWQGDFVLVLVSLLLALGAISLRGGLLRSLSAAYFALLRRPLFYHLRGDYDAALQAYQRELARRPQDADARIGRATVYLHLGEKDLACQDVERALALDPTAPVARLLRGELFLLDGQADTALSWYNTIIRDRPDWFPTYADRGALALERGQLPEALSDLERAIELNPRFFVSYLLRSMARFHMGDLTAARQDWEAALDLARKESLVFPEFMRSMLDGQDEWVEAYYDWAIRRLPRSHLPYHGRGDARLHLGHAQPALEDYNHALRLAPGDALLHLQRGRALAILGQREQARQDFAQAIRLARYTHQAHWASSALASLDEVAP